MKKNGANNTALHFSAEKGNVETIKLLINVFGEENKELLFTHLMQQNINRKSALQLAVKCGDGNTLEALLNINRK